MSIDPTDILIAAALGIAATLLMDGWNLFARRVLGLGGLDLCLLGRWVRHMPAGTFRHQDIRAAAPRPHECAVGWIAHYSIGIGLAVAFVLLVQGEWLARPTLFPALLFGAVTVVFPLFVLQPALGFGVASSRAPRPAQARAKSFATHLVFGFGLWAVALLIGG